jgi:regulator of cell morphogenesis and NO signaling
MLWWAGMSTRSSYADLDVPDLLALLADHHGRVKQALPWVRTMASKVAQVHGHRDPELLELDRLVRELGLAALPHLELEEERIFPTLAAGGEGPPRGAADLVEMTDDHLAIGQLLDQIRVAASDFRVPEWACVTYRKLMSELRALEADLLGCIHVESHERGRRTLSPPARGPA